MLTYLLSIATCHRNLEVDLPSRLQTDTPPAGWRVDQVCMGELITMMHYINKPKNRVYRKAKRKTHQHYLHSYRKA